MMRSLLEHKLPRKLRHAKVSFQAGPTSLLFSLDEVKFESPHRYWFSEETRENVRQEKTRYQVPDEVQVESQLVRGARDGTRTFAFLPD